MIPKIIHYCWFGSKEMPQLEQKCIESWKKMLPDYKIMFWNEDNFDVNQSPYARQALEHGKYAFVSDYARVKILYEYGGVYLDTDVEVLKSMDPYLQDKAFAGFENKTMIGTGIIGAEPRNPVMEKMLNYYANHNFADEKGYIDTTTNAQILSRILLEMGYKIEHREQVLKDIHLYERDIFCPKKIDNQTFMKTERTVTIHYLSGNWLTDREKRRGKNIVWRNVCRPVLKKIREILIKTIGEKNARKIEVKLRKIMK